MTRILNEEQREEVGGEADEDRRGEAGDKTEGETMNTL